MSIATFYVRFYALFIFVYRMAFYISVLKLGTKQIGNVRMLIFLIVAAFSCVALVFAYEFLIMKGMPQHFLYFTPLAIGQIFALPIILLNSKRKETNLKVID